METNNVVTAYDGKVYPHTEEGKAELKADYLEIYDKVFNDNIGD